MIPSSEKTSKYIRLYEIDWRKYPSVVFESDDWGACETAATIADAEKIFGLYQRFGGYSEVPVISTLENPTQLENLYQTLEKFRDMDGIPAVFTAFLSLGNPDFEKIRANAFARYEDIGIEAGVPSGWERGDLVSKWRDGFRRGVFHPEFHSTLHHTSPHLWMQRLRADGAKGELARALFELGCYCQGEHLPEYHEMNLKQQYRWVKTGIERFERIFGFKPSAAVTSDAFPETETSWALNGIDTVCLKNCRSNNGETVVYATKPWNMQDVYAKIGDYNELRDVIYFTRNAFFESGMAPGKEHSAENVLRLVERHMQTYNEPVVISSHRINYAALDEEKVAQRLLDLQRLLAGLCNMKMHFLTTFEVGQLYRKGWSMRMFGDKTIFRKWHDQAGTLDFDTAVPFVSPECQQRVSLWNLNELPTGTYLLEGQPASQWIAEENVQAPSKQMFESACTTPEMISS